MERPPNALSGSPLDRVAERRTDTAWVAAAFADPAARVVPVCEGRVLVGPVVGGAADAIEPRTPTRADLAGLAGAGEGPTTVLLGLIGATPHVAVDVAPEDAARVAERAGAGAAWSELRPAALVLSPADGSLVAYARAMVWWHSRHGFCGVCGGATEAEEAGHVRACTRCDARHFPRTDPAVIVLVTHRPEGAGDDEEVCLLGSAPAWPEALYSTLAGFVEPGESLEEAVRREIREEAGVVVHDVEYHSSQPWPFPQSLMLGFNARAADRAVRVDGVELRDARWFTRAELERGLGTGELKIPPRLSISRRLIDDWRNARAG